MLDEKLKSMNVSGIIVKGKAGTLEEWLDDSVSYTFDIYLIFVVSVWDEMRG